MHLNATEEKLCIQKNKNGHLNFEPVLDQVSLKAKDAKAVKARKASEIVEISLLESPENSFYQDHKVITNPDKNSPISMDSEKFFAIPD